MCSGTLAWPQWTNQSQCDAKFSFVLFTWAKFKWNLGEKNSFVLVLAYIMHPVWTSQVLCVWLLAVFYPLTETLEQILSPKLQHLGAAFSSSGTAVLHVCTGCEEGQDHQLLGPTEGPQTTLLPCPHIISLGSHRFTSPSRGQQVSSHAGFKYFLLSSLSSRVPMKLYFLSMGNIQIFTEYHWFS